MFISCQLLNQCNTLTYSGVVWSKKGERTCRKVEHKVTYLARARNTDTRPGVRREPGISGRKLSVGATLDIGR